LLQEGRLLQADEIGRPESRAAAPATAKQNPWLVLGLLFTFTVIMFVARQALPIIMAFDLRKRLGLSPTAYGIIVSALGLGMMTGEFPMGLLMDKLGARKGLSIAAAWWSAATGSLALAAVGLQLAISHFWISVQLGLSQFWKGTGECGAYSGGVKTVNRLFEKKDRTLAIGIFNGGSVIGATLAPPIMFFLMQRYGSSSGFLAPALAGFLWIPLWWFFFRREPRADAAAPSKVSMGQMLAKSSSWAIMLCRFFIGPVMQFYWYWMPLYFNDARHWSMKQFGFLGWIPYLMGDVGGIAGGWAAGVLLRRQVSIRNTRRILMYGSALVCVSALAVPYMSGIAAPLVVISIAITADNFLSAHMFAAATDLFPDEQVGRATGLTGIAGGISGMLFPLITGWIVGKVSYAPVFLMVAFMPLAGTVALFAVGRKYRQLDKPAATAA
jgi:MFS transporter, ACS family, hexuronate transporter